MRSSWERFMNLEPDLCNRSERENNLLFDDHHWWKRAALAYSKDPPTPIYVSYNNE